MINKVWLPQALSINVDYRLFYELSPNKLEPFYDAFKKVQEMNNSNAWIQGLYIQQAICSSFSNENKYPNKPYDFVEKSPDDKSKEFEAWAQAFNSQFNK